MPETYETESLDDVPIWSTGTYNGDEYNETHLDQMVTAFDELRGVHEPPLVAGHSPDQTLIQKDGWPALGWIDSLKRDGNKLFANIKKVPKTVATLIRSGAYQKVSPEIYWDFKHGDKQFGRVLRRVALLGADIPANGLVGFSGLYQLQGDLRAYFHAVSPKDDLQPAGKQPQETRNMSEQTERLAELESENAKLRQYMTESTELTAKLQQYEKREKELEATIAEQARKAQYARLKTIIDASVIGEDGKGKILPKTAPYLYALAMSEDGVRQYEHRDGDKSELLKYEDKTELVASLLESMEAVELGALTSYADKPRAPSSETREEKMDRYYNEIEADFKKKGEDIDAARVYKMAGDRIREEEA